MKAQICQGYDTWSVIQGSEAGIKPRQWRARPMSILVVFDLEPNPKGPSLPQSITVLAIFEMRPYRSARAGQNSVD